MRLKVITSIKSRLSKKKNKNKNKKYNSYTVKNKINEQTLMERNIKKERKVELNFANTVKD